MAKPVKPSLTPSPTFKQTALFMIPGGKEAGIEFIYKYRERDEFKEFLDTLSGSEGAEPPQKIDVIMDIASGWDLDEPFDRPNVEKMLQKYMASAEAAIQTYIAELTGAGPRTKN